VACKDDSTQLSAGSAPGGPLAFQHRIVNQLTYAQLRFEFVSGSETRLPEFLGSTLRGCLASAMRRISCALRKEECPSCMLRERCHYSVLFETPPDTRLDAWQKQTSWPRPIVIEPPELRVTPWQAGEVLPFDLLLFGRAAQSFPYLVLAASRMAKAGLGSRRSPFRLKRVLDLRNSEARLFIEGQDRVEAPRIAPPDLPEYPKSSTLWVRFKTPTRILDAGRASNNLEFGRLVKAALSRVSSLVLFHCGGTVDGEPKEILEAARSVRTTAEEIGWVPLKRWSNRQKQQLPLDGFIGRVGYDGAECREFWPLLKAGELTHVGKGTVFGLGKYGILEREE